MDNLILSDERQEADLETTLVGTSSAVKQARNRVGLKRPATVLSVEADRSVAMVVDDHDPLGIAYGATVICPSYLQAGDRVMLEHYPPHGTLVVGLIRGGKVGWSYAGNSQADVPGFFGTGWANDSGTGALDTDTYPQASWTRTNGVVELRGRVHRVSGAANLMIWLPPGFRPRNNLLFCVVTAPIAAAGVAQVKQNGQVSAVNGTVDSGSGGFMHLDGIHFSVE